MVNQGFLKNENSVKTVRIQSFTGSYSSIFRLNTERYGVSFRIHSESGKIWNRETPNTDTFHLVKCSENFRILQNSRNDTMKHGKHHQIFPKKFPKTSIEPIF